MNPNTLLRLSVLALLISFLSAGSGFCANGSARGMASIDVKYSSMDRITKAATDVFTGEGYDVVSSSPDQLVFERPANRAKDLAYGGVDGKIIEQVVIGIKQKNDTLFWVSCDAYMIKGRGDNGDDFFADKTAVMRAFAGSYRKLLNQVKIRAEAGPTNVLDTKEAGQ